MSDAFVLRRPKAPPSKPLHRHDLIAAPLVCYVRTVKDAGMKRLSMHPDAVRARELRINDEKLKLRWLPGRWVRNDAVSGFIDELEATRPEFRDRERSEKECDELAAEQMRLMFEERYGRPKKLPKK